MPIFCNVGIRKLHRQYVVHKVHVDGGFCASLDWKKLILFLRDSCRIHFVQMSRNGMWPFTLNLNVRKSAKWACRSRNVSLDAHEDPGHVKAQRLRLIIVNGWFISIPPRFHVEELFSKRSFSCEKKKCQSWSQHVSADFSRSAWGWQSCRSTKSCFSVFLNWEWLWAAVMLNDGKLLLSAESLKVYLWPASKSSLFSAFHVRRKHFLAHLSWPPFQESLQQKTGSQWADLIYYERETCKGSEWDEIPFI